MANSLSLISFHDQAARLNKPCHWSPFLQSTSDASTGTRYHVVGNPFQGYQLDIDRDYTFVSEKRKYLVTTLGEVKDELLDKVEEIAKRIVVPGVSKTPLEPWKVSQAAK